MRCFTACLLFLSAFIPICVYVIAHIEVKNQQNQAEKLSEFIDKIVDDVNYSLLALNKTQAVQCNHYLIEEMHKVLIKARFVKEAGFILNDKVVCSTSQGIMAKPRPKLEMDFDTGRNVKIYVDIPLSIFSNQESAPRVLIAERGSFYVAIDRSYIQLTGLEIKHWEVVHKLGKSVNHVYGQFGVYDISRHLSNKSTMYLDTGIYTAHCHLVNNYCASTVFSWLEVLVKYRYLALFLTLACLFSIYILVKWLYPFKHKQKSLYYRVKSALRYETFSRVYQPIVDLKTEKIVGFEMLSRLEDDHGAISPDQFIPIIKQLNMTWEFTVIQVKSAIAEIAVLDKYKPIKLNFNIFPEDLTEKNVSQLIEICSSVSTKNVTYNVEIIEDKVLDTETAIELIGRLARNNILVSIDDFGTGYSNLSKLSDFHCDFLKIDREFIANIESASLLSTLVPQIKDIAHRFGLKTVAEGIENAAQKEMLSNMNIELGQGWYFSKPLPINYWRKQMNINSKDIV